MRNSVVTVKLRHGAPALISCLNVGGSALYEMASLTGFDARWTLLDHHS